MKTIAILIMVFVLVFVTSNIQESDAAITGSANFCSQFPTYPECTGWRVEPVNDNFWFCEYVDLPKLCNNPPNPQKQIMPLDADFCCRIVDDSLVSSEDVSVLYYDASYSKIFEQGMKLPQSYPVNELVIWTDKNHYHIGDRVNVYGKFNFDDIILKSFNDRVDIKFNDREVITDLPVRQNGWFAGFFFINNPQFQNIGINNLSVSYNHKPTLENPDKIATKIYQFTTGKIKVPIELFTINIPKETFSSDESIPYTIEPEISSDEKLHLILRITNPDGVVFSLPSTSMNNLKPYLEEISSLIPGNYTITMTVGDFTTDAKFEYIE